MSLEVESFPEFPERNTASLTPWFWPVRSADKSIQVNYGVTQTSNLKSCEIIHECYFKSLNCDYAVSNLVFSVIKTDCKCPSVNVDLLWDFVYISSMRCLFPKRGTDTDNHPQPCYFNQLHLIPWKELMDSIRFSSWYLLFKYIITLQRNHTQLKIL